MGNPYFQFKQFIIWQEECAMKVCTDGCILGAYVSKNFTARKILDIGSGTGLLTLMLAQSNPQARIDGVEINEAASITSKNNVAHSAFKEQITIYHTSIQEFTDHNPDLYDLIVSNPPFFKESLRSENPKINLARHDSGLTADQLLRSVRKMLKPSATFTVMYPAYESEKFIELALAAGLHVFSILTIQDNEKGKILRSIVSLRYESCVDVTIENLIIKDSQGNYTFEFNSLLKPYYLNI